MKCSCRVDHHSTVVLDTNKGDNDFEDLGDNFSIVCWAGADPDIRQICTGECQILWPKNCPL